MSIQKTDVDTILKKIKDSVEVEMIASSNRKDSEKKLKEEFAEANKFYKKDGKTLDVGKVKLPILKGAIEVKVTGVNKLEEKLNLQDSYLNALNSGIISKGYIDSYVNKLTVEKDSKNDSKDIKNELKSLFDGILVEATNLIVRDELKAPEEGGKTKDNSELEAMVKEIKKLLGK